MCVVFSISMPSSYQVLLCGGHLLPNLWFQRFTSVAAVHQTAASQPAPRAGWSCRIELPLFKHKNLGSFEK
jgi:hypothetical protein